MGIMAVPTLLMVLPLLFFAGEEELLDLLLLSPEATLQGLIVILLLTGVFLFAQTWAYLALLCLIQKNQVEMGILEAYKISGQKLVPFAWVSTLLGLIVFLGMFLLIIPGILFLVWYGFAPYILVGEDLKGMEAISKSKKYVRGNGLEVFWKICVVSVITVLIPFALEKLFGFFNLPRANFLLQILNSIFLWPFATIFYCCLYESLKEIHDAKEVT